MSGDGIAPVRPGEVIVGDDPVVLFGGVEPLQLSVLNTGDRLVQVGSHFHFAEVNEALELDRVAARGLRLAVPAGTSVRFEPGIQMDVDLIPFAGSRIVAGFRGAIGGPL